jgi:drug/metabolite transporter (DMT)-like permease
MFGDMVWFLVSRVLLSVSGNALQKRLLLGGMRVTPMWIVTYGLMLLPALLLAIPHGVKWSGGFWFNVLMGGLLDAAGNLAMVAALRATDLSVFGPLNAFRPVLALLFGWLFLGEVPSRSGGAGVVVIVLGALLLLGKPGANAPRPVPREVAKVLGLRLAGLSLSTVGAVFLKRAALLGPAETTLAGWIVCGLSCLALFSLGRGSQPLAEVSQTFREQPGWLAVHALLFFVMQWLTIKIFQSTLLAYSFAWFQLGMVLQVLTGGILLKEPAMGRRVFGCAVMCIGCALVLWKG